MTGISAFRLNTFYRYLDDESFIEFFKKTSKLGLYVHPYLTKAEIESALKRTDLTLEHVERLGMPEILRVEYERRLNQERMVYNNALVNKHYDNDTTYRNLFSDIHFMYECLVEPNDIDEEDMERLAILSKKYKYDL